MISDLLYDVGDLQYDIGPPIYYNKNVLFISMMFYMYTEKLQ